MFRVQPRACPACFLGAFFGSKHVKGAGGGRVLFGREREGGAPCLEEGSGGALPFLKSKSREATSQAAEAAPQKKMTGPARATGCKKAAQPTETTRSRAERQPPQEEGTEKGATRSGGEEEGKGEKREEKKERGKRRRKGRKEKGKEKKKKEEGEVMGGRRP